MRQRSGIALVVAAFAAALIVVPAAALASPTGCVWNANTHKMDCGVSDPGQGDETQPPTTPPEDPHPGGGPGDGQNHDDPPAKHGGSGEPNEGQQGYNTPAGICLSQPFPASPQPAASDPGWEGHTAADNGQVMQCRSDPNGKPFTFWQGALRRLLLHRRLIGLRWLVRLGQRSSCPTPALVSDRIESAWQSIPGPGCGSMRRARSICRRRSLSVGWRSRLLVTRSR